MNANGISHLPQYDEGYLSIGCQPCTPCPLILTIRDPGDGANEARMRHSHFFGESRQMSFFLGFLIAVAVGLTVLAVAASRSRLSFDRRLTAGEAVGTAFVFAASCADCGPVLSPRKNGFTAISLAAAARSDPRSRARHVSAPISEKKEGIRSSSSSLGFCSPPLQA